MSNCIHGLNRALVECEQCRSVERAKEFNTTKAAIEQAAIQSFARLLTEGDGALIKHTQTFCSMHSTIAWDKIAESTAQGFHDKDCVACAIRQAANLPLLKEVSNGQT